LKGKDCQFCIGYYQQMVMRFSAIVNVIHSLTGCKIAVWVCGEIKMFWERWLLF